MGILGAHQCGLPHITQGYHQAERRGGSVGQGDHARDVA